MIKKNNESNKINWLLFPFLNIFYILKNSFNGIVFVFFKLPANAIKWLKFRLNKDYKNYSKHDEMNSEEVIDKKKIEKIYKYSAKTMAKLEASRKALLKELEDVTIERSKEQVLYMYTAKNPDGKIIKDTMLSFSKNDLYTFLMNEGYEVYDIKTNKKIAFFYGNSSLIKNKMSVKDLIFWLTQLSTYLKAGITLSEGVKILSKQMGKKSKSKFKALQSLSYHISIGEGFSSALEKQGEMFPSLLINMVRAAEASGTLIETLEDMADYYTEVDKTKKQMVSAMMYPLIISFFALAVVTFIILYIIPQFEDIYASSSTELPAITRFIMNLSTFLSSYGLFVFLGLICFILIFALLYKKVIPFKTAIQTVLMKLPVVGNIIIYNELTIFTKTFASLLKNNVFITNSMEILMKITNNEIYKKIMTSTINNIIKGNKISDSFKDQWAVPDVAYFMIVTGESTGELAEMMEKVSDYYQDMHRNTVNNLKAFIEPVMIAFLAFVVGGIILAVIIPMFGMYDAL